MNWDNVEMIRNAQASAKARFEATALATQEEIQKVVNSEAAKNITMPRLTELEQMIFKMRSELIDYIVAHGLVDGLIWDGVLQPIQNGKIVITKEMIEIITEYLGYFTEADVQAFLEEYLPKNHYVSDADYVHTDNNYTTDEKNKLAGIEAGAEVNKIIDVIFNGVSVLDDGTRVATITITPEDIKRWYEENPDTNAFTDAQKAKLAGISDGAEVNRVDDVLVNGRSVLNENKNAIITKEIVKEAYEANKNTNAFTDAAKSKLEGIEAGAQVNKVEDVQLDGSTVVNAKKQAILTGAAIKKSYEAQPDTNAFTDAEKSKLNDIEAGAQVNKVEDVQLAGASVLDASTKIANVTAAGIKTAYESNDDTNAFTDADKAKLDSIDGTNFIPYTGASKNVDLGDHTISCAAPTEGVHAANKSYVDAEILTRLPVHNVKAYGAKGDGTTRDDGAIQSALNEGGIVYFPPGTYLAEALIISKPTTVLGSENAVIKIVSNEAAFYVRAASNISGIKIIGFGTTRGAGIEITAGPSFVSKTSFTNLSIGVTTQCDDTAKVVFCVRDCEFSNFFWGVEVNKAAGTIDGCTFVGNAEGTGVMLESDTDSIQIENCRFENTHIAISSDYACIDTKIVNCFFLNTVNHDICLRRDIDRMTICGNSFVGKDNTAYAVFVEDRKASRKNIIIANNIMGLRRVNLRDATQTLVVNNIETT